MELTEKQNWLLVGTLSAVSAGIVAQVLLSRGWRRATGRAPPRDPVAFETSWIEAILWTAAIGLVGGVARLLARRIAALVWRLTKGAYPPGVREEQSAAA